MKTKHFVSKKNTVSAEVGIFQGCKLKKKLGPLTSTVNPVDLQYVLFLSSGTYQIEMCVKLVV